MKNFRDLMGDQLSAEILSWRDGTVVRRLTVTDGMVSVDALTVTVVVPLDAPITYQPWMMDRGSFLFGDSLAWKLCTEDDKIRFPNGATLGIYPDILDPQDEGSTDLGERSY